MTGVTAPLYNDLIHTGQNILIAGMTGSGKSVILNGLINSILYEDPAEYQMALVDLKMVEFTRYQNVAHCTDVAITSQETIRLLSGVREIIRERVDNMKDKGIKNWDGTKLFLIIDEAAELLLEGKECAKLLQSICQLGRAAGVNVIMATQCPLAEVIPTRVKINFPIIIGLHTRTARDSRNILEMNGCEKLPMYGECLILKPGADVKHEKVPMIGEEWLDKIVEYRTLT